MKDLRNHNYNIRLKAIILSLIGSIILNGLLTTKKESINSSPIYLFESISEFDTNSIKYLIFSSPFLSQNEKEYLYNEDFLNDILPFINENLQNRIRYNTHFSDIRINSYEKREDNRNYVGYYNEDNPNCLYIYNYKEFDLHKDTLSHEFIHLCQNIGTYNTIYEACAEIISSEYFDEAKVDSYSTQVKLIKRLMEIIGSEPIWIYNFTNNFDLIENEVKPYLSEEEYNSFLDCLTFKFEDEINNRVKFDTLDKLIGILYKNKYNDDISNNEIMNLIDNNFIVLSRFYFNKRYIDNEHSFYCDRSIKEFARLSLQEAIDKGLLLIYTIKYEPITYEEAMEAINNKTFNVNRKIDYKKNDINITHSSISANGTIISGIIDGIEYKDVSVDYLVSQGIISADYFRVDSKFLTEKEYLNHEYSENSALYTLYSKEDLTLYDDYIEGYVPKITYLEPFNQKKFSKKLTN